jgi:hypothetical protein
VTRPKTGNFHVKERNLRHVYKQNCYKCQKQVKNHSDSSSSRECNDLFGHLAWAAALLALRQSDFAQ